MPIGASAGVCSVVVPWRRLRIREGYVATRTTYTNQYHFEDIADRQLFAHNNVHSLKADIKKTR